MSRQRILIVRLSAIGDVVHTLPALAALRRAMPEAHLAWIVESLSAPLLEGHPTIDELIVYPRARWKERGYLRSLPRDIRGFFGQMRRRRFDVAIDFQGLTKSALIPWLSSIPTRIGFGGEDGREISRWFYTARLTPPDEVRHVIHRNLHLLAGLGITTQSVEFPFPDLSAERERMDRRLEQQGIHSRERLVFLNPGAGWETKRWPAEYFGRLAGLIVRENDCGVLMTWGPGEEALVGTALGEVPADLRERVHRAPPTTLRELAALLDRCSVMVGGDTGPVHLAAARGVPVVGIYGGSDPKRNGPITGPACIQIIENTEVECIHCWQVHCDNPPPKCLITIKPETVFEAVRAIWNRFGVPPS